MEECAKNQAVAHSADPVKSPVEFNENCVSVRSKHNEPDIHIYPAADLPIPSGIEEKENEIVFLDPSIGEGKRLLYDKTTTTSQLFAMMRQFITPVCSNFSLIVDEMRRRGVGVNDIDSTTGMTMLHYAVRAVALAEKRALAVVRRLLDCGGDPRQRCLYSDMNSLHMAAYFDLPSVCLLLLKQRDDRAVEIDSLCESFHFGTCLHIAAFSLSCKSVEILLQKGACFNEEDDLGRTAEKCIPDNLVSPNEYNKANHIREILSRYAGDSPRSVAQQCLHNEAIPTPTIGCRVTFRDERSDDIAKAATLTGTLRYVGNIPASTDEWAGVELDTPEGNNSGNLGDDFYFKCRKNHGLFVKASSVTPVASQPASVRKSSVKKSSKSLKMLSKNRCEFKLGDRVVVVGSMVGTVRFVGETRFASGVWCGVELDDEGPGRNNGTVGGVSYFACPPARGIFSPPSKLSSLPADDVPGSIGDQNTRVEVTEIKALSLPASPRSDAGSIIQCRSQSAAASLSKEVSKDIPYAPPTPDGERRWTPNRSQRTHSAGPYILPSISSSPKSTGYLRTGMRVEVKGTNQNATVRYLGETDFAPGVWVGLDLGQPQGRNDGSVQGRRYFSCSPKHGVMLRPTRVFYKGVSGATMLPPGLNAPRN